MVSKFVRGRPITTEEFDRMPGKVEEAVAQVKLEPTNGKPGRPAVDRRSKTVSSIGEKVKVRVDVKKAAEPEQKAVGEKPRTKRGTTSS